MATAVAVPLTLAILWATACTPIELPGTGGGSSVLSEPSSAVSTSDATYLPPLEEPVRLGEQIPDLPLLDQNGRPLDFEDFLGTVLVVSFFSCQQPDNSPGPAIAHRLLELQATLRPDLWESVHILTVSVEPSRDTTSELLLCAERLGADLDRWTLALSPDPEFPAVAARLGMVAWPEEDGQASHTLSTLVIDQRGMLTDRFTGLSQWTVADLIASVVQTAER